MNNKRKMKKKRKWKLNHDEEDVHARGWSVSGNTALVG
jgi:hypothetical protein